MAELDLQGTSLVSRREIPSVNTELCIICQKSTNDTVTSQENGRANILRAAQIRNDVVHQRLLTIEGTFSYHMNNACYKGYTKQSVLDRIQAKAEERNITLTEAEPELQEPAVKKTRSSTTPRNKPSGTEHIQKKKCIICGKTQHGNTRDKCRISESPRANVFLAAAMYFQDAIYTRIADLEDDKSVFGADLYYHRACLPNYLNKHERALTERKPPKISLKRQRFCDEVGAIRDLLDRGIGLPLSDIRDAINDKYDEDFISNKEVKLYLTEHFQNNIQFCPSERRNESMFVFSSALSVEDVVKKLRSVNVIKEAAETIREALTNVDFNLNDKFGDAHELKSSWEKTAIPDCLVSFFSSFLKIPHTQLQSTFNKEISGIYELEDDYEIEPLDTENSAIAPSATFSSSRKVVQVSSMFQMMYYSLHNGRKKTPLHLMTGHTVYDKCKSRELITSLNRIGISCSYNEVRRARGNLANYALAKSQDGVVPLPSHFVNDNFTLGALDNFDSADRSSASGKYSTHDTVMVLFQEKPQAVPSKPNVSDFTLPITDQSGAVRLSCQNLKQYTGKKKFLPLPESLIVDTDLYSTPSLEKENQDFVLDYVRMLASSETTEDEPTPTWAGCHALVTKSDPSVMQVGFLPFLPYPVTDDATVYTALITFLNVLKQLKQKCLPVICDEGVFRILAQIVLQRPIEFQNILPMLGCFHLTKVVEHCLGKLLKGSGIEDALVETNCFGLKILEQVLGGTHYVRSLRGLMIIYESLRVLQWEAFLMSDTTDYSSIIEANLKLKTCLKFKDVEASKRCLEDVVEIISPLKTAFNAFCAKSGESSEVCRYWNLVIQNIQCLRDLVWADRCGDWEVHLQAVQKVLPIFAECDSINYLRYGSLYLEIMRKLPESHPEIYREFMKGNFVVKTNTGMFNAVAPDMKLEQTIQRSQKSTGGIVGETRQIRYVTEWEMIYHEVTSISNTFRDLIKVNVGNREYDFHHELHGSYSIVFNEDVRKVARYIDARDNPFKAVGMVKLHNFVTSATVDDVVGQRFLNFNAKALERYTEFRTVVYIERTKKLSDTIKRAKLPSLSTSNQPGKTQKQVKGKSNDETLRDFAKAQKDLDIARSRKIPISDILEYDLWEHCPLFDGEYPTKPKKYILVSELIKMFEKDAMLFDKNSALNTVLLIDFMSLIRRKSFASFVTFTDLFESVWKSMVSTCHFQQMHVVYDSYVDSSVKECERQRRSTCQPLEYLNLQLCSKVPTQSDRFWASAPNKERLQELSRQYLANVANSSNMDVVLSGVLMNDGTLKDCVRIAGSTTSVIPTLVSSLEEADARIVPHAKYAFDNGFERAVVISNDTDVVALLLYFMNIFSTISTSELWILYGTGENSKFIPIHLMASMLGPNQCSAIMKAHVLTGCDVTSQVGSKTSALKNDPEKYLSEFAEDPQLTFNSARKAEEYLVKVLKPQSDSKTFDNLRLESYTSKKVKLVDLPPTSSAILGHLKRCHFVIRYNMLLLNAFSERPQDHGWTEVDGFLIPDKHLVPMPLYYTVRCGCKSRCTGRCRCSKMETETICTEFCNCKGHCQNV